MKKRICLAFVLVISLIFGACIDSEPKVESSEPKVESSEPKVESSESETTDSESESKKDDSTESSSIITSDEEESKAPAPAHSELYLPNCSQQQMFDYFEEIVLRMEYGTGDSTVVQKWAEPLRYSILGTPTEKDLEVLTELFEQLNEVDGFPGIYAADGEQNLTICFLSKEDFNISFSDCINGEDAYGATQFWYYNDTNEIYTSRIGYRTDVDQATRVSILIEEIINTLGVSDTVLREDSIVYQYSNDNTALSDIDWVILKLLYNSKIKCGMNADSCNDIVKELYY